MQVVQIVVICIQSRLLIYKNPLKYFFSYDRNGLCKNSYTLKDLTLYKFLKFIYFNF